MSDSLQPAVCIDAVLANVTIEQALAIVDSAGITAFEFWGWWDRDLAALTRAKERSNLQVSACCTKFVSLVDPSMRGDYLRGLQETLDVASRLGCRRIISQVGDFRLGVPRSEQHASLVDGLRQAAALLSPTDVTLVIEPLNELVDHPGYYLIRSDEAFEIIDEVASSQVQVVYDVYHQQISEGHLIRNIAENIGKIGHFHAAGNPGRHELTTGEINYQAVFDAIRATEFKGYVGLEYWPQQDPLEGLRTVAKWFDAPPERRTSLRTV